MTQLKFRGKIVGTFREDRVFVTERRQEHFFRKFHGFGMSYDLVRRLLALNCRRIIILYHGKTGVSKLITTPTRFYKLGIVWRFGKDDTQTILPMKYFNKEMPKTFTHKKNKIRYKEQQKNKKLEGFM